ncbi:interleukin 31 [Rhinolophus ferrumequinum]|uniref:Interleukin 31 n=1 Tax=Rhinolophus ferrumequinum TaxID=59479 RepID=A0A7J7RPC3_RHIFE|nr:interleukin 31 [Rhinolophus ferrumequinum]
MVSHTGPAKLALFLLCCMRSSLSFPVALTSDCEQGRISKELQFWSKELLRNHNERGLLDSRLDPLPRLTSSCQPPNIINSSTILPYFKAIRELSNDRNIIDHIIDHLHKLNNGPETEVLVPEEGFQRKMFIFAVKQAFSTCMESLSPMKMCEASKTKDE